jgi:hypothetical protein
MNTQKFVQDFISFIFNPPSGGWLLYIETAFILASLTLLIVIIYLLSKSTWLDLLFGINLKEFMRFKALGEKKLLNQWAKINKRLEAKKEDEYKMAVIEADSLLDEIFQNMGYKGETVEERMRQAPPETLPDIDKILEAHRIRNNIAHDPDYKLSLEQAKETLGTYEKALKDLEAI